MSDNSTSLWRFKISNITDLNDKFTNKSQKRTWWQSFPSWLIILLFTCIGILYALFVSWDSVIPSQTDPTPLPPLPVSAIEINSIIIESFFQATPQVQTIDGQIYSLIWKNGAYMWKLHPSPSPAKPSNPCTLENIALFEESGITVIDCQVVETNGEWCPGTIVSIAIIKKGDVWELVQKPSCRFFFVAFATLFAPAGFAFGVIIVVIRKIFVTIKERITS